MNNKKYKKLAVGGTFDKFHKGHEKLLETAICYGDHIEVGVTSDKFGGLKGDIDPCNERFSNLNLFLHNNNANFHIMELNDRFGTTITEKDFNAIVVSEETEPTAIEINNIRKKNNMPLLDIIVVSFVLADDGTPISSTRIRKGEINKTGQLIH